ncbi:hypothetical protein BaRGS_00024361 [Batillaria attramentaria]|uniref:Major facilitator superfamily (MFS) profile domain-containing protein n=1 Tax=Batillaria attramentaria TaxID=370345 RepID=A0ABD0KBK0_9CAEN
MGDETERDTTQDKREETTLETDAEHERMMPDAAEADAEKADSNRQPPDGGWGWMVCFTSVCAFGTIFGNINTFGIIYVALLERFSGDGEKIAFNTSWVGSVCICMTFLMGTVAGILSDQLGLRKVAFIGGLLAFVGMLSSAFVTHLMLLYLTYGVIMGVGFSFVFVTGVKRLGLVNGLAVAGSTVFSTAFSFALPVLLKEVGLKYTLLSLSGPNLLLMSYALTWKPRIERSRSKSSDAEEASAPLTSRVKEGSQNTCCRWMSKVVNVGLFRNRNYVIWAIAQTVAIFGYFVPFVHLVKHSQDVFPSSNANLLPMCVSVASGVSCVVGGFVADLKCVNRIYFQQASLAVLGVVTICIPVASSFPWLIVICLVMGVCDGIFVPIQGSIAFDLVGPQDAPQALGFLYGALAIPLTVGFPIAGLMYDTLGSYTVAFHTAGALPLLGAIIMLFLRHGQQVRCVSDLITSNTPNVFGKDAAVTVVSCPGTPYLPLQ